MTLAEISERGEEYARTYNPRSVAPFPYENVLAQHADLEILLADLEDDEVSGVTLFKDERFTILINDAKPETRQNFTVGHELAHYFLHRELLKQEEGIVDGDATLDGSGLLYRLNGTEDTQIEIEANAFAASLLMPADLVRRAWEVTRDIEECAMIFKVSAVAMSVRLTHLGLVQ